MGNLTEQVIGGSVLVGMIMGICIDVIRDNWAYQYVVEVAHAEELPKEVRIEVVYNWTPERIEEEIRKVFWEDPDTAVKIAKCESGLDADIQSHHTLSYGREQSFGVFQIHAPDHDKSAKRLGFENYQTDVLDNLHMARYIYDSAGKKWTPWSCRKMI